MNYNNSDFLLPDDKSLKKENMTTDDDERTKET